MQTKWILCAGMMRSGSTVQYQLTEAILQRAGVGRGVWFSTPQDFATMVEKHRDSGEILVVKCHNALPGVREMLSRGEAQALYTYRDLRDVVVSYMRVESEVRKRSVGFLEVVKEGFLDQRIEDDRYWSRLPGVLLQRYEQWTSDLAAEALRIAAFIDVPLSTEDARALAAELSIDKQSERAKTQAYRTMYPKHVGSGAEGQWRQVLSEAELRQLEDWVGDWLLLRGYELAIEPAEPTEDASTAGQITDRNRVLGAVRARLAESAIEAERQPAAATVRESEVAPATDVSVDSPATSPRWVAAKGAKTLGVVMIVKNEAENLPHLFRTIQNVADEVVVVDTGSTDETLAVCTAWGVKIVREEWRNDFAWARNRSIEEASARYLLWLDADDRVPDSTGAQLAKLRDGLLRTTHPRAFVLNIHNTNATGDQIDAFRQLRLFPRDKKVRFRHAIHERITDSIQEQKIDIVGTEMSLLHTGYADPALVKAKNTRNEALIRAALEQEPENVHHLFHLAQTMMGAGRFLDAERHITQALTHASTESSLLQAELHMMRAAYRTAMGNTLAAAYDLEQAIVLLPDWGAPYASLAQIRADLGDWASVRELTERGRNKSFAPGNIGLKLTRLRSNLEVLAGRSALEAGQREIADAFFRAGLEIDPKFVIARMEYGQNLLDLERYDEALRVLEPLGDDESAISWVADICTGIGLARAMTGDEAGAGACLAPLLDLFAKELEGATDVSPLELAEAMFRAGRSRAAGNMLTLFQKTMLTAA